MASRKLQVEIVGDASSLKRAFGQAERQSSGMGRAFGTLGKAAALGLGAAGVGGALAVMKVGFAEAQESALVMAQTGAVLKSTGKIANVTAKDVEGLAGSLSRMSGVDDEAIQTGENMLLTFTKIRNEVGKGNDVFNQATQATLDLSVAMGKDMQSSAILVGKALNDPVKGMSALSKAGIQFTAEQKNMIKAMVESGDSMGAQKLILKELETQFGGSAKAAGDTMPGQLAKAKVAFEEVSGQIMTQLLPTLVKMLQGFSTFLVWLQVNWPKFREVVVEVFDKVRAAATQTVAYYNANIKPAIQNILAVITGFWRIFGDTITSIARAAFVAVTAVIRSALTIIKGIFEGITALLRGDWSAAWNALKSILSAALASMVAVVKMYLQAVVAVFKGLGGLILQAVGSLGSLLYDAGRAVIQGLLDGLMSKLGAVRDLAGSIGGMIKGLKGPITKDRVLLVDEGKAIMQGLEAGMLSQLTSLKRTVAGIGPQLSVGAPGAVAARSGSMAAAGGTPGGGFGTQVIQLVVDGKVLSEIVRREDAKYLRANGAMT